MSNIQFGQDGDASGYGTYKSCYLQRVGLHPLFSPARRHNRISSSCESVSCSSLSSCPSPVLPSRRHRSSSLKRNHSSSLYHYSSPKHDLHSLDNVSSAPWYSHPQGRGSSPPTLASWSSSSASWFLPSQVWSAPSALWLLLSRCACHPQHHSSSFPRCGCQPQHRSSSSPKNGHLYSSQLCDFPYDYHYSSSIYCIGIGTSHLIVLTDAARPLFSAILFPLSIVPQINSA